MKATTALRGVAITIAVLAAIDPAIRWPSRPDPVIAVMAADPVRDAELLRRVTERLDDRHLVVPAPFAGAVATVIAGAPQPVQVAEGGAPLFVVLDEPAVAIAALEAPARVPLDGRAEIAVTVRTASPAGKRLVLTLQQHGAAIDRSERTLSARDSVLRVPLAWQPPAAGAAALRVHAAIGADSAIADLALEAVAMRWPVLVHEARPSWQATFVRRALEDDRRFDVAARAVTSRGVSSGAGTPPTALADLLRLASFDVIVIGAPEALADGEVRALDRFLRERGGTVVLLLDDLADGPWRALTGVPAWRIDSGAVRPLLEGGAPSGLWGATLAKPAAPPVGAVGMLADSAGMRAAARVPVGAGRLIVMGALDAWRWRDRPGADFAGWWRRRIAAEAMEAPAAVALRLPMAPLAPGAPARATVTLRDPSLTGAGEAAVTAALVDPAGSRTPLPALPTGVPGELAVPFTAPDSAGWRLEVAAGAERGDIPVVTGPGAVPRINPDGWLGVSLKALGGEILPAGRLDRLPDLLDAIVPPAAPLRRHPMRSPWWIVPFALALAGEWWLRRRRGDA